MADEQLETFSDSAMKIYSLKIIFLNTGVQKEAKFAK